MVDGLRKALRARPRAVLAILLAFAVEIVPPALPFAHRHAGGDRPHAHAAPGVGLGRPAGANATSHRDGWHRAFASNTHRHAAQAVVSGSPPVAASVGPAWRVDRVPAFAPLGERYALTRPGQARSPPDLG